MFIVQKIKKIVICIMGLSMAATATAQVRIGVKGGLDITEMSFKHDVFNTENRLGWFFGPTLMVGIPVPGFSVDISALYNQRETKIDLFVEDGSRVQPLKTKQLIVPLNFRYSIGLGDLANVFAFAGPQVAFRVGDDVKSLSDVRNSVEWRMKSSNFSVNVGAGFMLSNIQITANYNVGVGSTGDVTWDRAAKAAAEGLDGKYNSWQIAATLFF